MRSEASVRQLPQRLLPVHRRTVPGQHARPVPVVAFAREGHGGTCPLGARPARRRQDRSQEGNQQDQERIRKMNEPFDIYTHNVCGEGNGDIPDWMFYAICALPYVLLALDFLGGK